MPKVWQGNKENYIHPVKKKTSKQKKPSKMSAFTIKKKRQVVTQQGQFVSSSGHSVSTIFKTKIGCFMCVNKGLQSFKWVKFHTWAFQN